ncbi:hypothetical protein [Desulfomonile tiedjei]|uniref:Uncharacterized protein n=1 Tax=Desulfomonile tiedjei (strain ATCC 49306 / DSM 6799 / DCB-1) TaxID=706587 RepID=I4C2V2_DESTA|nr:hypothetical protein [Desulfomonile tiedjei]AFM23893.1 hypothetical protein Desti_1180 [Desulfomonile tiedjei DSM 6799]
MWDRALGILMVLILVALAQTSKAEEFLGKLERVDWETVTVVDCENKKFILRVDGNHRKEAAVFLGKRVLVDFKPDDGHLRAVRFRASQ